MCLADTTVALLAGGLGTRLGLPDRPKCLAEVQGKPLLEHLLAYFRSYGATQFVLCAGHRGEQLTPYASDTVVISQETQQEGTAAALVLAYPALTSRFVLVANGDTLLDVDLCRFVAAARVRRAATILTTTELGGAVIDSGVRLMPQTELYALALERPKNFEEWLNRRAGTIYLPGRFLDIGTPEKLVQAGEFIG